MRPLLREASLRRLRQAVLTQRICPDCQLSLRLRAATFSTRSALRQEDLPYTERLRRRIWGTDNPPGLKDPYDRNSGMNVQEVEKPKAAVAVDTSYVPATTWDGLEQIGDNSDAWRKSQVSYRFESFQTPNTLTDPDDIFRALHRATVEVFTCADLGVEPTNATLLYDDENFTHGVQVDFEDGAVSISYPDAATEQNLKDVLTGQEASTMGDGAEASHEGPADAFLHLPLSDPKVKFALVKRVFQLTNRPIRDPDVAAMETVDDLLRSVSVPIKPPKLFELLELDEELTNLPNVKVHPRKQKLADKEQAIGRWKVIQEVLAARDLDETEQTLSKIPRKMGPYQA